MNMIREMRRNRQILSRDESIKVLMNGTSGVLALSGDDDYPYAVPLSYVYCDLKIFFHCSHTGYKLDSIKKNDKVSFCVIDKDEVIPEEYTTYFRSVIVFGKIRIVEDEVEKRSALEKLAARYSPNQEQGRLQEIDNEFKRVCILELDIEHMTGKEAIELVRMKNSK